VSIRAQAEKVNTIRNAWSFRGNSIGSVRLHFDDQ
jgi:hypothetical protein